MSRPTDSWEDASPFAWILGTALAFVALGGIARVVRDRRPSAPVDTVHGRPTESPEDESLAGHPT